MLGFSPLASTTLADDSKVISEEGGLSLAANAGSLGLSGQDVTFQVARSLVLNSGVFSLTPGDLLFNKALTYIAESGDFALLGQDVNLVTVVPEGVDYPLTAESGSFSVTGQTSVFGVTLVGGSSVYTLAGQDINISLTPRLSAEAGVFVGSFEDLGFLTDRTIQLESGTYSLTAVDATLDSNGEIPVVEYDLLLNQGSFAITYKDAVSIDKPSKRRFVNVTGNSENNTSLRDSSNKVILTPF